MAVKYVISQNSNAQAAAANEAVLGRLLAHPNVVQVRRAGRDRRGGAWPCRMAMAVLAGVALQEGVAARLRYSARRRWGTGAAAADACSGILQTPGDGGNHSAHGRPGAPVSTNVLTSLTPHRNRAS